jgi:hypothetical protein
VGGKLAAARAAYERRDWAGARDGFRAAAEETDLAADDLVTAALASWWLGDIDESHRLSEEAHRLYQRDGRAEKAAWTAIDLAVNHFLRGEEAMGTGWIGRALRLVDDAAEGPIHGYLAYIVEVEAHLGGVDTAGVAEAARRVQDLGRRFGDPTLLTAGLNGEGRALVKEGRVAEGLALLDEAMVSVMAGEVAPEWAGNIYCNTIAACHELGDLRRMATWTDATERWIATLPAAALFTGICRVHRAQVLTIAGDWARAEREASRVCEDLAGISVAGVAEAS